MLLPGKKWRLALSMLTSALLPFASFQAQALINVDRTRVIMSDSEKSISLTLENEEPDTPYLAQSWIENADGSRASALIALPPLQRIDGKQKSQIRVLQIKTQTAKLPGDRESLFYFNVRGIPPKPKEQNVVQIAQQSRIKLFWRPESLAKQSGAFPERKVLIFRQTQGLTLENPTPYYVTIVMLRDAARENVGKFDSTMLAPFSRKTLPGLSFSGNSLYVGYVDDYGGLQVNTYQCSASQCAYHALTE